MHTRTVLTAVALLCTCMCVCEGTSSAPAFPSLAGSGHNGLSMDIDGPFCAFAELRERSSPAFSSTGRSQDEVSAEKQQLRKGCHWRSLAFIHSGRPSPAFVESVVSKPIEVKGSDVISVACGVVVMGLSILLP